MKKILFLVAVFSCYSTSVEAQEHYSRNALRLGLIAGVNIGGEEATYKYAGYTMHPFGMFGIEYFVADRLAVTGSLFAGTLSADFSGRTLFPEFGKQVIFAYDTKYYGAMIGGDWVLPELWKITPVAKARIGGMMPHSRVIGEGGFERRLSKGALIFSLGGAFEYRLTSDLTLNLAYDLVLTNSDYLDGLKSGKLNDALSVITVGVNFLLQPGDEEPVRARAYVKRPVERPAENTTDDRNDRSPVRERRQESAREAQETETREEDDPDTEVREPRDREGGARAETRDDRASEAAELPRDQGLALNPVAPPTEVQHPDAAADQPLALYTQLKVTPLRRLRDLEDNPKLLTLKAWQTGDDEMQLKSYIEILRDGKAIYQGNADLLLDDALDEYTADEFLDLEELQLRNQGDALLPRGNYVVRVSTVAWDQELSSIAQGKFLNIDLRPIFGPRADDARDVIVSRAVDVSAEGDEELLVNFFEAGQAAADREQQSGSRRPNRLREPLMLAPIGTVGSTRDALISASVQHSFTEALKLQSIAGSSGRSEHLKIIVSEVYFTIDEDQLTEEGRLVLDNLARHLNQHPEQFAEVRGYANDVGDESYNETLARRRAQRVLEYLVRQKMNAYRIKVADVDDEQLMTAPNQDPRLGRKVEIILKNRGM